MSVVLAAGGRDDGNRELTTVEVFDVRDGDQWLPITQLPVPCGLTTSAILHDNWYVITDSKQAMCAFLPELSAHKLLAVHHYQDTRTMAASH